ncbi:hypothetical protein [Endozoicomonas sp. ONNA1]|uniref:hypothetical protein n=1 Tax=Endozoicomonas sp. ONNA1 TaxID=2828740 RepID=UPI0021495859|nr:hypothetical protein [Endozoicomonas sp. ONNA1]
MKTKNGFSSDTLLSVIPKVRDIIRSAKSDSLIEYTQPTRVEPICMVESKLQSQSFIGDVLQSVVSLFSAYYLQAASISMNVGRVDTIRLLDKLNPNRDPLSSAGTGAQKFIVSTEDYKDKLPSFNMAVRSDQSDDSRGSARGFGRDTIKNIDDSVNLSVGKVLEVQLEDDGHRAVIPVMVRLNAKTLGTETLSALLTEESEDRSVKNRYHRWRAGELQFVRDLVLCQDLIDNRKKALKADKDGIYEAILTRKGKNKISSILSGDISVNTASSIVVLSKETAKDIERRLNFKLDNFRKREDIFKATSTMLMVVVDVEWEQVTIYHRSLDMPTELSVKDIKKQARSSGPDVSEILKAYQLSNTPTF